VNPVLYGFQRLLLDARLARIHGEGIKQAFRKLARKHIPTSIQVTECPKRASKESTRPYEVLGDPEKRKKYDELGANWRMYNRPALQGGAGFDPRQGRRRRLERQLRRRARRSERLSHDDPGRDERDVRR